jgi:hypothetical protein
MEWQAALRIGSVGLQVAELTAAEPAPAVAQRFTPGAASARPQDCDVSPGAGSGMIARQTLATP